MSDYILGLNGGCCDDCSPNNSCTAKPVVSGDSLHFCIGRFLSVTGYWGTNTPTSRTITSLPTGLSYNAGTNIVSGTPVNLGTTNCPATATNACGTGSGTVAVTVHASQSVTSALTATGLIGSAFSYTITVTGTPTTYFATPLPAWLSLDFATGILSGTPTSDVVTSILIGAFDASGFCGASDVLLLSVGCPAPTLQCDSISASLTKCGFNEWPGHVSSPPKKYLVSSLSGVIQYTQYTPACAVCLNDEIDTYSGDCSYSAPSCSFSSLGNVNQNYSSNCITYSATNVGVCSVSDYGVGQQSISYTSTVKTVTGTGSCVTQQITSGTATETLSSEYSTADLITYTVAALPSYPGTWSGTCSSYRNLTTDELTYSIRRFKYRFQLPTLTGFASYVINWFEGSTPMSYTWNGTDTYTPEYTVNEPGSNGTVVVSAATYSCSL